MSWDDRKKRERMQRLKLLKEKKEQEELKLKEANDIMALAQKAFAKKDFAQAAELFTKSSEIFQKLGWDQQAEMLLQEASNMEVKKKELEEKSFQQQEKVRLENELYDNRAKDILAEKERLKQLEEEARNRPSPELQLKMDRALMLKEKAEKLVLKGKTVKAIARYEYLLLLYQEIGYDAQKIDPIQQKITVLKNQILP